MQKQSDPIARLCVFTLAALVLMAFFIPGVQAQPQTEATILIVTATPALNVPAQPAPVMEVRAELPTPVAIEAPALGVMVSNEGARPSEHNLPAAPVAPMPPSAVQAPAGAVLIEAHDGPGFAAVVNGEGSKPARHRP